jgi:hypothetical protein
MGRFFQGVRRIKKRSDQALTRRAERLFGLNFSVSKVVTNYKSNGKVCGTKLLQSSLPEFHIYFGLI